MKILFFGLNSIFPKPIPSGTPINTGFLFLFLGQKSLTFFPKFMKFFFGVFEIHHF